jgi:O-antigen ligase
VTAEQQEAMAQQQIEARQMPLMILCFVLPWLIGAVAGPVAQLGGWLAVGVCLVWLLFASSLAVEILRRSMIISVVVSVGIAVLQFSGLAAAFFPWVSASDSMEAYANLRQRNQFASLTALGLWALLCGLMAGQATLQHERRMDHAMKTGILSIGVVWLALGNAMSSSRTGAVQWLALAALMLLCRHRFSALALRLMVLACAAYVMWLLVMPMIAHALDNSFTGLLGRVDDANALSRLALWSNVIELIAQKPWLGHGWGSLAYAHYGAEFSGVRFMELLDNAHNLPLHVAVELGLPVALAVCAFVVWAVVKAKPWAETNPERLMAWGMLLVIGIHSMLEYPLWYGPFFMTAVLCIGILCSDLWRNWLLAVTEYAGNAIILGVRGLGVVLLALTAFAAFDYHRVSQIYLQPQERSSWYADDALGAAQQSVLFKSHAKFAELVITPLSRETAPRVLALSSELVAWSPEPRVIEKLIESSVMLGVDDLAAFHLKRYAKAYPQAYAAWAARSGQLPS